MKNVLSSVNSMLSLNAKNMLFKAKNVLSNANITSGEWGGGGGLTLTEMDTMMVEVGKCHLVKMHYLGGQYL